MPRQSCSIWKQSVIAALGAGGMVINSSLGVVLHLERSGVATDADAGRSPVLSEMSRHPTLDAVAPLHGTNRKSKSLRASLRCRSCRADACDTSYAWY